MLSSEKFLSKPRAMRYVSRNCIGECPFFDGFLNFQPLV
jgi:hypothetical protein